MYTDNHLGHAYPFVFQSNLPADSAIADIDILILRGSFDPNTDYAYVMSINVDSIVVGFSNTAETVRVPVSPGSWTETATDAYVIKVLAGLEDSLAASWVGQAIVEPCRIAVLTGANQVIEVYNRRRTHTAGKPGCMPVDFGTEDYVDQYGLVYQCGPLSGDVELAGGYSAVVSQYGATSELIVRGDVSGGELGRPCDGQFPLHANEVVPDGYTTLDGSPRCADVLRSINGVTADNLSFLAGVGVSVYPQPEKSRVTIRFDGAGSARCPVTEILQAECPPPNPFHCGPVEPVDLCPDVPDDLASLRNPNQIPPLVELPIIKPGTCLPVPSKYKHLTVRGCTPGVAAYTNSRWRFTLRCLPHCAGELPTRIGKESEIASVPCTAVPPDSTIGIRNNDFGDELRHWGYDGSPFLLTEFPGLDDDTLPAIGLAGTQSIYQTEVFVPHRSTLKFGYIGKLTLVVVSLGRLCVEEELDSEGVYAVYSGNFLVPANQPISIQFSVVNALDTVVISLPYLAQS